MESSNKLLGASLGMTAFMAAVTFLQDPAAPHPERRGEPVRRTADARDDGAALRRLHGDARKQIFANVSEAARGAGLAVKEDGLMFTSIDESRLLAAAPAQEIAKTPSAVDAASPGAAAAEAAGPIGIVVLSGSAGPGIAAGREMSSALSKGPIKPGTYVIRGAMGRDQVALVGNGGEQIVRIRSEQPARAEAKTSESTGDPQPENALGGAHPGLGGDAGWWKEVYAAILLDCCTGAPGIAGNR